MESAADRGHEGQVLDAPRCLQPSGKGGIELHVDGAMLVDRELRRAGPDAEHAEPDDVAFDRTNGVPGRGFQAGWIHCRNDGLAQLDTCVACARDLLGLGTPHDGDDGLERSIADQLLDERVAHRSRCAEDHSR